MATVVALREVPLKNGRCEYLLPASREAVDILGAKPESTPPSGVANQLAY